jgi:NAD(P)-dependent dehydrogenase (short-subunit alcohol dehydrogenase family)
MEKLEMTERPVCLITGASTGIGAACARLAGHEYDLVLNYRTSLEDVLAVQKDVEVMGCKCLIVQGDIADPHDIHNIFKTVDSEFGHIDVLINNAGIVDKRAKLTEMDHSRISRIMNVNVIGAMLVAKEAVSRMQTQGTGGVIINISSAAARLGAGNQYVDYAASKGAIDTFTKGLSDEVAGDNIRVVAVRPGVIITDIHGKGGEPERAELLGPKVPMQRAGSAEEVAEGILWLASSKASYVTGTALDISGGR